DHPLLGAGLPLHLGGTAPPALLRSPRLGADARDGVQRDAARAVLGRDAERAAHAARRMGPRAYGPDPEVHGRRGELLRDEHVRGPDDVDPRGERPRPLHELGGRSRAQRRARLGRHDLVRHPLLARAAAVGPATREARLATTHFWLATAGIVLYTVSMWAAGLMEGLMWRAVDDAGQLKYPNFTEIVMQLEPFYWLRVLGGAMYLVGAIMMTVNFVLTVRAARRERVAVAAAAA